MKKQPTKGTDTQKRRHIIFWPRKLQRPTVETLVLDTASLVDFTQPTLAAHPIVGDKDQVINATKHALVASAPHHLDYLKASLAPVALQPAATYSRGRILGSSWHHGEHYTCYWIGTVSHITQRSDLTENEREHLLATARKLGSEGKIVYAVATSREPHVKTTNPSDFQPRALNCVGLISHDIRLQPDLARSLALCKQQEIDIIYASHDDELLVSSVAHKTHLVPKTTLPYLHIDTPLKHGNSCYAGLSTKSHDTLLAQFDASSTLITNDPLPLVVKTIRIR